MVDCGKDPATGLWMYEQNGVCVTQAQGINLVKNAGDLTAAMEAWEASNGTVGLSPTEFARAHDLLIQGGIAGVNFVTPIEQQSLADQQKTADWTAYFVSQFPVQFGISGTAGFIGPEQENPFLADIVNSWLDPTQAQASTLLSLSGFLTTFDPVTGDRGMDSSSATPISISAVPDGLITEKSLAYLKSIGALDALQFTPPTRPLSSGQVLLQQTAPGAIVAAAPLATPATGAALAGTGPKTRVQREAESVAGLTSNLLLVVGAVALAGAGVAALLLAKPRKVTGEKPVVAGR